MKLLLLSLVILVTRINASAYSEYVYPDQPLIQARFDHLIPRSYPTIQPDFDRLLQTNASPLISPGAPQIHITENLSHPTEQPLLIVN
jgi:hypothetical protein